MGTLRNSTASTPVVKPTAEHETARNKSERGSGFAHGSVTEGEVCFLGSLHELVAIGLYRPSLEALVSGTGAIARPRWIARTS